MARPVTAFFGFDELWAEFSSGAGACRLRHQLGPSNNKLGRNEQSFVRNRFYFKEMFRYFKVKSFTLSTSWPLCSFEHSAKMKGSKFTYERTVIAKEFIVSIGF